MDQKVSGTGRYWKKFLLAGMVLLVLGGAVWASRSLNRDASYRIEAKTLRIGEVSRGSFEDIVPIRGRIVPRTTVFLDAVEGGRVDRVYVEDGALLQKGDIIAGLSNSSLQLSVINSEAQVSEQLNNMRGIELSLEQNRLRNTKEIADIEFRIQTLSRELREERKLSESGLLSRRQLQEKEEELVYQQERLELSRVSREADKRLQQQQLEALRVTTERLEKSLKVARQNLEDLNVRAPLTGKLSGFDVKVGENIVPIGQIDVPGRFKLEANIDEFYINRVAVGQMAHYQYLDRDYPARIEKIYPQVKNGDFLVDLLFINEEPPDLRRGQTLKTDLTLGDAFEATLIPNGAFYQDTGGAWIFVLNADGSEATRRKVKLGRRNSSYIEVLNGLEAGEKVVISAYEGYLKIDRLKITHN
jgi:HlyD family secretion protein